MQARSVAQDVDIPHLRDLFDLITTCDGHAPIGEHKYLDLVSGSERQGHDLVIERDGVIVAYVAVNPSDADGTSAVELAVHPLHRSMDTMKTVVAEGVRTAKLGGARRVRAWAFTAPVVAALRRARFHPERELRQLRRPLPIDESVGLPDGVAIKGFRVGSDEEAWLDVNNAAFADHPENGAWTREILADRQEQPWFSSDGFRMAWSGGKLVAFCWTKMHGADMGEIYVIAVAPGCQGRGLGRAMVLEGLRWMQEEQSAREAMLYVDADNRAALRLYDDLGFELDHIDRSFVLEIDQS